MVPLSQETYGHTTYVVRAFQLNFPIHGLDMRNTTSLLTSSLLSSPCCCTEDDKDEQQRRRNGVHFTGSNGVCCVSTTGHNNDQPG